MYMSKTRVKSARNWNTRPPTHSCQRFGRKELRRKEIAKTVFREREREREKDSIFLCWYNRSEKTKIKSFLGKQRGSWFFFWSNNLFSLSLSLSLSLSHLDFSTSSSLSHALCTQIMGIFLVLCEDFCGFWCDICIG